LDTLSKKRLAADEACSTSKRAKVPENEMYHIFNSRDAPPPPPVVVPVIPPVKLFTLPCNSAGRNYVARVPYELFKTAESSKKACLNPAPVIGLDGKATHLYFEIASWSVMWNGLNKKTRADHEVLVAAKIKTILIL
jgi:hypothetical protein